MVKYNLMSAVAISLSLLFFLGCAKKPTEEQIYYFRSSAANTESITIYPIKPKNGGKVVITSPNDIMRLRIAAEPDVIHEAKSITGDYRIVFKLQGGGEFEIIYSTKEDRIRFPSRWNIESTPYENFRVLFAQHLEKLNDRANVESTNP